MEQIIGDYKIHYTIKQGQFGKVKRAEVISTGEVVAIKKFKKQVFDKQPELIPKIHREIALLRLVHHPHILQLHEIYESPNHLYLVMEMASHGDLYDYTLAHHYLSPDKAIDLFRQLIYGVEYLHIHAICHRDLKLDNLMLDEHDNLKIGDFDFAKFFENPITSTSCGSPHYAAPEIIRGEQYNASMVDIWSCGVILYILLFGRYPFEGSTLPQLFSNITSGKYAIPPQTLPIVSELIAGMLTVDPSKRFTIPEIKAHPAFRLFLPENYVIPKPLPLPVLQHPFDVSNLDPVVMATLEQIGFGSEQELLQSLFAEGPTMAKVFYTMLTTPIIITDIPWEAVNSSSSNTNLTQNANFEMIIPNTQDTTEYWNNTSPFQHLEGLRRRETIIGSPESLNSLPERSTWSVPIPKIIQDQQIVQPCTDIEMSQTELATRMQILLSQNGFTWLFPNDELILAHKLGGYYLEIKFEIENDTMMKMNLMFTRANQDDVAAFLKGVENILFASL